MLKLLKTGPENLWYRVLFFYCYQNSEINNSLEKTICVAAITYVLLNSNKSRLLKIMKNILVGPFETRVIKRDGPLLSSEFLVILCCSVQSDLKEAYSGKLYQQGCDES